MPTAPGNDLLTKSQQSLRARDVRRMSVAELHEWIDACDKAERLVKFNKARRTWSRSRLAAVDELQRRGFND